MRSIDEELQQFIKDNTWQELCREWVLYASAHDELPVPIETVGSEWKRTYAFDVLGVSFDDRTMVVGNCHWSEEKSGIDNIHDMVRRTPSIIPDDEEWSVYYVGFSAAGWTETAVLEAESVASAGASNRGRKQWQSVGVQLVDLQRLDEDMARWVDMK